MDPLSFISSDDDGDSLSLDSENDDQGKEKQKNKHASGLSGQGKKLTIRNFKIEGRKPFIEYEALSRHGYYRGPSVLNVPPPRPKEYVEQDWSWSAGKHKDDNKKRQEDESYKE